MTRRPAPRLCAAGRAAPMPALLLAGLASLTAGAPASAQTVPAQTVPAQSGPMQAAPMQAAPAQGAPAQAEARPPVRAVSSAEQALRQAISGQLAAFRAGDLAAAFAYASPQIQARFRSPENFGRMVAHGYPMVLDARRTIFGALSAAGTRLRQSVLLVDGEGRIWAAEYLLLRIDDAWRIDGVQLRKADQQGI